MITKRTAAAAWLAMLGLNAPADIAQAGQSQAAQAAAFSPSFSERRVAEDIRILASDAFEGRSPATRGETLTVRYLIDQFRKAGLQPGGERVKGQRGWTQAVPLQRSVFVAPPDAAATGLGPLIQGKHIALRPPQDGRTAYRLTGAPLVFVGYGVHAPELGWDDFKGLDLHGKIAVVLVNDPDFADEACRLGCPFGGKAMTYYGRWTYKFEEMARRGAAGALVIHEDAPAAYGWATVSGSNTFETFDTLRQHPERSHTPLEGWISRDTALALFKASGLDLETARARAMTRAFAPMPLTPRLDVAYRARVDVIRSRNVVALLPGRTRPRETVLYSAHWDHLGLRAPDATGDHIANGARDNAAGTALLLELARAWAKAPRPARSIVFLAVTAEERGLLGSDYYGQNPLYPLATSVAGINFDGGFNPAGATRDFTVKGVVKSDLLARLTAVAKAQGMSFAPEAHPEAGTFYRSDHFSLSRVGVPALSYDPGLDLVEGGVARGEALRADYIAHRYHQNADNWSPDWSYAGALQTLAVTWELGRELAEGRDWPAWDKGSEFAAIRARTAILRDRR
jgi:Zn-dependent M28 family amino/carboxypeptidase